MKISTCPLFLLIFCLLVAVSRTIFAQAEKAPKDAAVWVTDDTHKVHPVSGNLLSEGLEVYSGAKPGKGDYRLRSHLWDSDSRRIKLFAGRNEFVSFQVVIEKGREDLHKVLLTCTDLLGSRERISADSHIRMFKQLYLELDGVRYPDALVPLELAGITPLELPDYSGAFPEQKVQSIWVDIYVPRGLPPDTYNGQINILHRNTNLQAIVRVELEVGNFTLPDEMNLAVDLMNYGFINIERGWPDMLLDSPRHRKIEREFYRMAHAHRTTFNILPYNHDGMIPRGLKPELAGVGEKIRVAGWKSWDERFGPVLSGEAFADLPRAGQPVSHFFLPYCLMWPSDMRNWGKSAYREEHLRISRAFREHFKEKGWTRPQYQIYYNHKEHYRFFPWNLDEPTREKDLEALKYLGEILDEGFPADDPVEVAFRLDIGHFYCENVPTCSHPRQTSHQVIGVLGGLVDLWNIGSPHYWANLPEVRKLKSRGKTAYFYNGTPRVPEPLLNSVFWGWYGLKYEADGVCFWNATDWGDWDTDAPPQDPYTNAGGRYQGFSMIFYPGYKFGHDGPVPSMRIKGLRRGFQDYEYACLLESQGLMTRRELIELADNCLLGEEKYYFRLRRTLFDKLNQK
ncbi:MAG: DUF4091 domain-containing protein [Gemmatimonadota bacterium]|nr:DUF4091 domain-containing protein [Gemmatimonadota bacterium]